MTVRRLTPEDMPVWREVRLRMLAAEPGNYGASLADWADRPLADWEDSLTRNAYVASMADGVAVGAMGLWPETGRATWHRATLVAVWLEPEWRGSGRAEAMLAEIVAMAVERGILQLGLNVNAANSRAIRFYERQGFSSYGRLPRAVFHGGRFGDDLLMVRMLDA